MMGKKPKKKKGNINNLFLVCNVGSQNNAIFGSVCMKKKKRKKRVVTSRGKHNMDVMTSVTSCQAFFFWGGKRRGGGGERVTPSKEKGKKDRLIAGYDLSCKPAIQRSCWGAFFV